MKNRHYTYLLYFISLVILVTLGIQAYWNYKNYQIEKKELIKEVRGSFNDALDAYYLNLREKNTITVKNKINFNDITILSGVFSKLSKIKRFEKSLDSLKFKSASPEITFYFPKDSLKIDSLNTYIYSELKNKGLSIKYGYKYKTNGITQKFNPKIIDSTNIYTVSKSGYLPEDSTFSIYFTNATSTILKRNSMGIILSFILVAAVVACLFWLLNVIKRQKQLAELKNDLIGNITHEFKTPISTIGVALEGIQNFNEANDPVKTKNYLETSTRHLKKLGLMVEKLLETASLDSGELELNREPIQLHKMLRNLIGKHKALATDKEFEYSPAENPIELNADAFHLENAINNLLDNAVKYGGNRINISTEIVNDDVKIGVQDNGRNLKKEQAKQIFDKFYRVPQGNIHDVKGFGIGLYYTRKIIEKHGGNIYLNLKNSTQFIITLPYG